VATIADVARKAGVSVSTVSHVLNGTRRVAPNTARAVQDVIDSFGYKPNILARSLKAASTRSVGIALSSITNPYFVDIISAIETECARLGMMMFLSDTEDDPARELEVVMALHQRRVDGIILAPSADPDRRALAYLREARLPCVLAIGCAIQNLTKSASTIARRCACSLNMSRPVAMSGSAMSAATPALRRRSSASPAIATA
jgi:LacI family transcriptional regulator